ncbi:VanZ family protein [Clavibacter zhangzhiyongii]|uniref:VanZ family protein n=1 Tax=Clavibacter zhangzhiyongii TaxID=2768071 RepID=A0A7L7YZW0_9MICO|nr:VanZ family protein [Clavibacter zhangzhiyongii]MBM7025667.1 VanZ family protein [Clavibacter zhangzhiyongii]QOD43004.1 VanZ family protein [Clavibacter zhangzhiyongii]
MLLRHPLLGTATALYLGLVAWITLSPEPYDRRIDGFLFRALGALHRHDGTAWITYSLVEGAANVAMFVPVGMFLVLLLGRSRWWLAIALGVGLSALIELAQAFLPTRVSDVRDLLHNGLGALVGVVVVLILTARSENARRRALRQRREPAATEPRRLVGTSR